MISWLKHRDRRYMLVMLVTWWFKGKPRISRSSWSGGLNMLSHPSQDAHHLNPSQVWLKVETNNKYWLVVEPPLWKMMEFVSWDDEIPNWMEKSKPCSKPPTRRVEPPTSCASCCSLEFWIFPFLMVKSPFCLGKSRPKPAFYEELQQGGYLKATTGWTPDWVKMLWTYHIVNPQKIEKHRTVIHQYNICMYVYIYICIYYRYVIFVLYQFIFSAIFFASM